MEETRRPSGQKGREAKGLMEPREASAHSKGRAARARRLHAQREALATHQPSKKLRFGGKIQKAPGEREREGGGEREGKK